jgi:homoserine acetyltransferase
MCHSLVHPEEVRRRAIFFGNSKIRARSWIYQCWIRHSVTKPKYDSGVYWKKCHPPAGASPASDLQSDRYTRSFTFTI